MKCIDKLRRVVEDYGGSIDMQGFHSGFINLDTPIHYIWNCTGCSTIVIYGANAMGQSWWIDACKEALEDVAQGVDKPDVEPDGAWWVEPD